LVEALGLWLREQHARLSPNSQAAKAIATQPEGEGLITGQDFETRVHEVRDKGEFSGEPVELGDQERRFALAGSFQGLQQLRPVGPLACLDLNE
jgi:hypothetical protein